MPDTLVLSKRKRRRMQAQQKQMNAPRANVVATLTFLALAGIGTVSTVLTLNPVGAILGAFFGLIAAMSPKIAKQWERAVVLRVGRYRGLRGPGLFWIVPFIDTVAAWIDQRVITTSF